MKERRAIKAAAFFMIYLMTGLSVSIASAFAQETPSSEPILVEESSYRIPEEMRQGVDALALQSMINAGGEGNKIEILGNDLRIGGERGYLIKNPAGIPPSQKITFEVGKEGEQAKVVLPFLSPQSPNYKRYYNKQTISGNGLSIEYIGNADHDTYQIKVEERLLTPTKLTEPTMLTYTSAQPLQGDLSGIRGNLEEGSLIQISDGRLSHALIIPRIGESVEVDVQGLDEEGQPKKVTAILGPKQRDEPELMEKSALVYDYARETREEEAEKYLERRSTLTLSGDGQQVNLRTMNVVGQLIETHILSAPGSRVNFGVKSLVGYTLTLPKDQKAEVKMTLVETPGTIVSVRGSEKAEISVVPHLNPRLTRTNSWLAYHLTDKTASRAVIGPTTSLEGPGAIASETVATEESGEGSCCKTKTEIQNDDEEGAVTLWHHPDLGYVQGSLKSRNARVNVNDQQVLSVEEGKVVIPNYEEFGDPEKLAQDLRQKQGIQQPSTPSANVGLSGESKRPPIPATSLLVEVAGKYGISLSTNPNGEPQIDLGVSDSGAQATFEDTGFNEVLTKREELVQQQQELASGVNIYLPKVKERLALIDNELVRVNGELEFLNKRIKEQINEGDTLMLQISKVDEAGLLREKSSLEAKSRSLSGFITGVEQKSDVLQTQVKDMTQRLLTLQEEGRKLQGGRGSRSETSEWLKEANAALKEATGMSGVEIAILVGVLLVMINQIQK